MRTRYRQFKFIHDETIKSSDNAGFTLMEILVAVGIFSILSVVIIGIYVAFSNSQARAKVAQQVLNDSQYALEVMAQEIRNNAIYYGDINCNGGNDNCLRLQRPNGDLVSFMGNPVTSQILYSTYNNGSWHPIEIVNAHTFIDVDFIVTPDNMIVGSGGNDPFVEGGKNQQPKVTIRININTNSSWIVEQVNYVLQTTVSSRVYKR